LEVLVLNGSNGSMTFSASRTSLVSPAFRFRSRTARVLAGSGTTGIFEQSGSRCVILAAVGAKEHDAE
jgi:hypothetical protein